MSIIGSMSSLCNATGAIVYNTLTVPVIYLSIYLFQEKGYFIVYILIVGIFIALITRVLWNSFNKI